MRISELVAKLQEAMAEHGDLPAVVLVDDGYGDSYAEEVTGVAVQEPAAWGLDHPAILIDALG